MKIITKVGLIIAINALFFIALGVYAYFSLSRIEKTKNGIVDVSGAIYQQMTADMAHDAIKADVLSAVVADETNADEVKDTRESLNLHTGSFMSAIDRLSAFDLGPEIKDKLATVRPALQSYTDVSNELVKIAFSGDSMAEFMVKARLPEYEITYDKLAVEMEALSETIMKKSEILRDESSEAFAQTITFTAIAIFLVLGISVVFGLILMRSIIRPIHEVNRVVNEVARGNLDEEVKIKTSGEMLELNNSLGLMRKSLKAKDEEVEKRNKANDEVRRVINKMAEGDLRERFSLRITDNEELQRMGDGLNNALDNVGQLLNRISKMANLVASSAEEMLTKGEQMRNTTREVASATQQMAEGTQQQAQQTDESSRLIDAVLGESNEVNTKAELIQSAAETGKTNASEGLGTVRKVVESMQQIQSSAHSSSASINVLTERSEEITRALTVITGIASQTNLLALNAAIEAARAGEAGRGFSVVADEIRKLAEDSRRSAVEIEKVIREVQKDIISASKAIDAMERSVINGNSASKDAETVFQQIEKMSSETLALSRSIVDATNSQKQAIQSTVKNIEKIVVVAEETASGTEQIASSSKELSLGMNEVTATSRDLADVATQLLDGVSKFKL
ncbi:MAG: methyl-accepting chemotaxis protein [Bacteroidia bacterium]|jgi:methyl-accepting chemotaxis protein|nr:methyl-accepting chemotaxis protein [Bacteroidia bacterium]